ncbi:hypothetical protein M422DRAFT_248148 [Sphaerobolus stellatus SS14]|uniref:Uncharacterized protein n=1 Tax=Sphaerobolus stellatus (strain SS14) TaxID=990650 RepID=A0A0C9W5Z4_SPHS4|nr:hypothetical protein M422DRAFT_248148 [Sphaerobolus stellatus SS14]
MKLTSTLDHPNRMHAGLPLRRQRDASTGQYPEQSSRVRVSYQGVGHRDGIQLRSSQEDERANAGAGQEQVEGRLCSSWVPSPDGPGWDITQGYSGTHVIALAPSIDRSEHHRPNHKFHVFKFDPERKAYILHFTLFFTPGLKSFL